MKHEVNVTAKATAGTVAIIYLVCAGAVILFPGAAMGIAQTWFHGLDLGRITTFNVTTSSFIIGLITSTIGGWLVGYVFASAYNYFLKK